MNTASADRAFRWMRPTHAFASAIVEFANAANSEERESALRSLVAKFRDFGYDCRIGASAYTAPHSGAAQPFARDVVRAARRWPKLGRAERVNVVRAIDRLLPKRRIAMVDYAVSEDGRLITVAYHPFRSIDELVAIAAANLIGLPSKADRSVVSDRKPASIIKQCIRCRREFVQRPDVRQSVACVACRPVRHREMMQKSNSARRAAQRAAGSMGA